MENHTKRSFNILKGDNMKNLIIYYSRRGQNYVNGSIKSL